jgi:uncharacterized protein YjgD (DUF1641 family)
MIQKDAQLFEQKYEAKIKPCKERVVAEQKELGKKLIELIDFIRSSPVFQELPMDEQVRLKTQRFLMEEYYAVLRERIGNFPSP